VVRVNQGTWLKAQGIRPKKKVVPRFAQNGTAQSATDNEQLTTDNRARFITVFLHHFQQLVGRRKQRIPHGATGRGIDKVAFATSSLLCATPIAFITIWPSITMS
jgi:hypothetical protein